jgi:hypothetical protein
MLLMTAAATLALPRVSWGQLNRTLRTLPRGIGLAGGAVTAILVVLLGQALGWRGLYQILGLLVALLLALMIGVYLPSLEARQHAARCKRLQIQAMDFAGAMLLALGGPYGDVKILRDYIKQPRRNVRDMQAIIASVLDEYDRNSRGNVLDLLHQAAVATQAEALIGVTSTLRQVLAQDRSVGPEALKDQRRQLLEETIAAYKKRAQRLEMAIMGVAALSLFCGLLFFILYVMTGGGTVLQIF